jgi:APA family basic amino acid/polyamine antiporter
VPAVASIHPRFETPAYAIALQAALASVLVLVGTFNDIISYFVFVVIVFVALTVIALFRLRRLPSKNVGYLTPGYPVTPIIFLALIVLLLVLLGGTNPKQAFLGVAVVSLGLPFYLLVFRRRRSIAKEGQASYDLD